jgi:hypothetical protein
MLTGGVPRCPLLLAGAGQFEVARSTADAHADTVRSDRMSSTTENRGAWIEAGNISYTIVQGATSNGCGSETWPVHSVATQDAHDGGVRWQIET